MTCRWEHRLSLFCFAVGIAFMAAAAFAYFAPRAGNAIEAVTDVQVHDGIAGQKGDGVLRVHNHSERPLRVLGMAIC